MSSIKKRIMREALLVTWQNWFKPIKHIPHLFVVSPGNKYRALPLEALSTLRLYASARFWRFGRVVDGS